MRAKTIAATVGTVAVAGILSAGVAQADVPAFTTPFLDVNCQCAGLLPGPVQTRSLDPGTIIAGNLDGDTGAAVYYLAMPSAHLSLAALGDKMAQDTGQPVVYGTYRGWQSFTTAAQQNDDGSWVVTTYFMAGNRLIGMVGAGTTADQADAELAAVGANLQII